MSCADANESKQPVIARSESDVAISWRTWIPTLWVAERSDPFATSSLAMTLW